MHSLSNVSQSSQNAGIADPHGTWWDPSPVLLLFLNLSRGKPLWNDMSNQLRRGSIDKMVRNLFMPSDSHNLTFPLAVGAPEFVFILLRCLDSTSLDIDVGIIGEFELDSVRRDKASL